MSDKPRLGISAISSLFTRNTKKDPAQTQFALDSVNKVPDMADVEFILASLLFDCAFYGQQCGLNSDAPENAQELAAHYLLQGASDGLDPHPLFDTSLYMEESADIAGTNPLLHFLRTGGSEGRKPNAAFDSSWYLTKYPDVASAAVNPLVHYLISGAREGRQPNPLFDSRWYMQNYKDAAASGLTALEHYVRYGQSRKYAISKDEYRLRLAGSEMVELRLILEQAALPVFSSPPPEKRINLVVDGGSVTERGAVESFVIIAAMLARSTGSSLRVVTRKERFNENRFAKILAGEKSLIAQMPKKVEFCFCDYLDDSAELAVSAVDFFLAVGRSNAISTGASVAIERVVYLRFDETDAVDLFAGARDETSAPHTTSAVFD